MATLVTVLKAGGRYDARWVARLAGGVRRHAPAFGRVICLTDADLAVPGVEAVPLRHGWPTWWSKMEALRPGLAQGPILLCDLDTVFTGPADALAEPGLAAMEDYFHKGHLSSALLRWDGDGLAGVYAAFAADPGRWMAPAPAARCRMPSTAIRSLSTTGCRRRGGARPSCSGSTPASSISTTRAGPITAPS